MIERGNFKVYFLIALKLNLRIHEVHSRNIEIVFKWHSSSDHYTLSDCAIHQFKSQNNQKSLRMTRFPKNVYYFTLNPMKFGC